MSAMYLVGHIYGDPAYRRGHDHLSLSRGKNFLKNFDFPLEKREISIFSLEKRAIFPISLGKRPISPDLL